MHVMQCTINNAERGLATYQDALADLGLNGQRPLRALLALVLRPLAKPAFPLDDWGT